MVEMRVCPECGKILPEGTHGNQIYCSIKCSRIVMTRRYISTPNGLRRNRENAKLNNPIRYKKMKDEGRCRGCGVKSESAYCHSCNLRIKGCDSQI